MPRFHNDSSAISRVAEQYARLLSLKITPRIIRNSIESNPDYPSLYCLTDTFHRFNVDNNAFEVSGENIWHLSPPFVAYMNLPHVGKDFVLVTAVESDNVTYYHSSRRPQHLTKTAFLQQFQHIVWNAQPGPESGDPGYVMQARKERVLAARKRWWWTALIIAIAATSVSHWIEPDPPAFWSALLLASSGMFLTALLLAFDMDRSNPLFQDICGNGGKLPCHAVLESRFARFKGISWSEVGFIYFSAHWLWLWTSGVPSATRDNLAATFYIFASPFILFSVFYQWRIIRQWCVLCLAVQLILLAQLAWAVLLRHALSFATASAISLRAMIPGLIGCLLAPAVLWYGLKTPLHTAKNARINANAYRRLQLKPEVFYALLQQQRKAPDGWQQLSLSIGNPSAPIALLQVCNPYCQPCARAHRQLKAFLERSRNISLNVVFTCPPSDRERGNRVIRHLLAIANEGDADKTRQALDDWYGNDNRAFDSFALRYPLNNERAESEYRLEKMFEWCEAAGIKHTPTIFVNGFQLPEHYQVGALE